MYHMVHFVQRLRKRGESWQTKRCNMDRRQLLAWVAGTAVAIALPAIGQAETFPSKPVRLVVPQAGGTGNDVLARALAEKLGRTWNQPVVVENKPGANGTLAINYVIGQPADGYTLFFAGVSNLSFNPF